ncbi:MAG: sulfite exporter TauE/SafE family protein, partial [Spirochaetota bacterium]
IIMVDEPGRILENNKDTELKYSNEDPNKVYKDIQKDSKNRRTWDKKMLDFGFNIMESLIEYSNPFTTALAVFIALFFGFVHSLTTGHGKTMMISYMLNRRVNFTTILLYISIIAFSHIIIMTGIGILSLLAFKWLGETYNILNTMPFIGAVIFLIISLFAIKEGVQELKKKQTKEYEQPKNKYSFLLTGFMIGLAPCPISLGVVYWSVFAVTKYNLNIVFMLMVMFIFGIGIFTALILIAMLVTRTRLLIESKFNKLSSLIPISSGLLMLIVAIIYIVATFPFR